MKTYRGQRTIDGLIVTVDDTSLDEQFDLKIFEKGGFEWGYAGNGPRQLALAILANLFDDAGKAKAGVETLMQSVITSLDNDWTLTEEEIWKALT